MSRFRNADVDDIKQLEEQLYRARRVVLDIIPPRFRELLDSFHSIDTRRDFHVWETRVVEEIIELTEPGSADPFGSTRARCPLCADDGTNPYASGFKLDEGLRRHLIGWGHARQCNIIREVFALAQYWCREPIDRGELAEEGAAKQRALERRKTDRLFIVDPSEEPRLLDESSPGFFRGPDDVRDPESLHIAEQRLQDIGFEIERNDRVTVYRMVSEEVTVLADPRSRGRITFLVYAQPAKRKNNAYRTKSFYILDSWKKNLSEKFRSRLQTAQSNLRKE